MAQTGVKLSALFKWTKLGWALRWHGPSVNVIPAGKALGLTRAQIVNLIGLQKQMPSPATAPAAVAKRAEVNACKNWRAIAPAADAALMTGDVQQLQNVTQGRAQTQNEGAVDPNAPWFLLNSYAAIYSSPVERAIKAVYLAATNAVATGQIDEVALDAATNQLSAACVAAGVPLATPSSTTTTSTTLPTMPAIPATSTLVVDAEPCSPYQLTEALSTNGGAAAGPLGFTQTACLGTWAVGIDNEQAFQLEVLFTHTPVGWLVAGTGRPGQATGFPAVPAPTLRQLVAAASAAPHVSSAPPSVSGVAGG